MRRSIIFFICVVVLCPSCYEPGDIGLFLRNESGNELSCFVADEINSGFSYPDTLLPANPNPFCIADNILESGWIFGRRGDDWKSILSYTRSGTLSVIYSNKKMWIISVGNILVNIMVIWFVMI